MKITPTPALIVACTLSFVSIYAIAEGSLHDKFVNALERESKLSKRANLIGKDHLSKVEKYTVCLRQIAASTNTAISQCDYLIPDTLAGFDEDRQAQTLLKSAQMETDSILNMAESMKLITNAGYFRICVSAGSSPESCGKEIVWFEPSK